MPALPFEIVLFLSCIGAFTLAAAVWDLRTRKIPNWLNVTGLSIAVLYQCGFHGAAGLLDGFLGFLVGFGIFFVLFIVGGGGGGDVKLMSAVGAFLGPKLTILVVVGSTLFVLCTMICLVARSLCVRGFARTKKHYFAAGGVKPGRKTVQNGPRKMTFALPVMLATWLVVLLHVAVGVTQAMGN